MRVRIFKIILSLSVVLTLILLVQCNKISRFFYVDELDLFVYIEEIMDGRYRINIFKSDNQIGTDYIEVAYKMSEMPSITMAFPLDDSFNIYVIEDIYGEVKFCHSENFNIVYPTIDVNNRDERIAYRKWCDSVRYDFPSISIRINAHLRDLIIRDENGDFIRKISPYY
ncbi:MAG: hypothetical protein NC095_09320 [Muribaculum sp.]|nr:hypothetical protein [Muribaculum sp.]